MEMNGGAGTLYDFRAGRIDLEPPDTTIQSGPSGTVIRSEVHFLFASGDPEVTFECAMDEASYSIRSAPKSYRSIASGEHTFHVRAVDTVGNADEPPATRSFTVAPPPTVTTEAANPVKGTEATLHGSVDPRGLSTAYQFEYGTTSSYGSTAPAVAKEIGSGEEPVEVAEAVGGLEPGTAYHFRLAAASAGGTGEGADNTFTTPYAPLATTEGASEISASEATLAAVVDPSGANTSYKFEYGTTTAYGSTFPANPGSVGSEAGPESVSETLNGLSEDTTYHYRVVAENEVGTTNGADQTFTTLLLPEVETEEAELGEANEAVLTAAIDPSEQETTYQFEYGTSAEYGNVEPAAPEELKVWR